MTIFMQGFRRSGTSITFKVLEQDLQLDGYYEPLAKAKKVKKMEVYRIVRTRRREYIACHPFKENGEELQYEDLNYGAPRAAKLEYEETFPQYVQDYLRFILDNSTGHPFLKFTRVHHKIKELNKIDPDAKFVSIIRDPRAIVTSYLFGKSQKDKDKFTSPEIFFQRISEHTNWSYRQFSNLLINTPEYSHLKGCEDFLRVLIAWKDCVQSTLTSANAYYGDRHFILRHHDLTSDSTSTLKSLYNFFDLPLPSNVTEWAKGNVRDRPDIYEPHHPAWAESFERLGITDLLNTYNLLKPVP